MAGSRERQLKLLKAPPDSDIFREAVVSALMPADSDGSGGGLPVLPLIELVVAYATPFFVSTITAPGDLKSPTNVCVHRDATTGEHTFLVADAEIDTFVRFFADGRKVAIAGSGRRGFKGGSAAECQFTYPIGICVDPRDSNRIYLGDLMSIRLLESTPAGGGVVSLLAGSSSPSYKDGKGADVRFHLLMHLVCTRDGQTLYVCDHTNCRIRAVQTKTGVVTTVLGNGANANKSGVGVKASLWYPKALSFDRTTAEPESVLFITCHAGAIMRFDLVSGEMLVIEVGESSFGLHGIVCTANGTILFTRGRTLCALNPTSGRVEVIAGSEATDESGSTTGRDGTHLEARFNCVSGMSLFEVEQCLMIADSSDKSIRRVTLPPELFR